MFPIKSILAAIGGAAGKPRPSNEGARVDVLAFSFHGMRFALPAARVVEVMPVTHERWDRLAKMAGTGTLGTSGLPLIRLASRLGFTDLTRPERGSLILFGSNGKVRATVLIDDVPVAMRAEVETMPAVWCDQFEPSAEMIDGVALLPDGEQALLLDLAMGVGTARPRAASRDAHDSAHLLVRAGRSELEAVRVAALRGMSAIDDVGASTPRRMLLLLGGEGDALAVDEVVGLAPEGRVERIGGVRFLATPTGRYRLLEPGETMPSATGPCRVLVSAPAGPARDRMRELVRSMGHDVSLADDPRAALLAGGPFDIILFDLDAYRDTPANGFADSARRIGFASSDLPAIPAGFEATVPVGDPVALIAALLQRRSRAA